MKMLFKGHSTRLEMLIEKIHSNKENSYQDSEVSGSTSSEIRVTTSENLPEISSDSPKSQSFSDTEEEKDWDETRNIDHTEASKTSFETDNGSDDKISESKSLQYLCTFCPRQFKHKRSRDRHIKLHTGDKKYKCIQCESAFARSDHLKIHLKTHDIKKHYRCSRCHKGYNTVSALCFHEKSHSKDGGNVESSSISSSENSLKNSQHSESFKASNTVEKHSVIWSQDCEEKPDIKTICVYCFQWFSSIEIMIQHVQICHRSFGNDTDEQKKYHLGLDISSRSKEITFDCDYQNQKEESNTLKRPKEEPLEPSALKRNHYDEPLHAQDTFICACCYERLPNFKSFLIHMESHVSSIKSHTCHQCGEELTNTLSNHTSEPSIVPLTNYLCCCHCDSLFEDSDTLQRHLIDHHVVTSYRCSMCDQTFDEMSSMKVHLNTKHINNKEHFECRCSENPKLFHDRVTAELHFSKYHSTFENSSKHQCKTREKKSSLTVVEEFAEHVSNNTSYSFGSSGHRCNYCKEYCKTKNDLQIHLRSHQISDKSRHKCNICDDTFTLSTDLATHKLIHCKIVEGNICVQCKTVLMDEETFIKHQLKHNDSSKSTTKLNLILPSICIVCGQTLQSDREIELHAKFHLKFLSVQANTRVSKSPYTEETVFHSDTPKNFGIGLDVSLELQCYLCKKSFTAKEKLQIHLIEHNFFGINQFSCYICSSVFTAAVGLQGHLLEHKLTEKPYQCSQCSAGFFFRAELDNHRYLHNFKLQFDYLSDESINQARRFTNTWLSTEISGTDSR